MITAWVLIIGISMSPTLVVPGILSFGSCMQLAQEMMALPIWGSARGKPQVECVPYMAAARNER